MTKDRKHFREHMTEQDENITKHKTDIEKYEILN